MALAPASLHLAYRKPEAAKATSRNYDMRVEAAVNRRRTAKRRTGEERINMDKITPFEEDDSGAKLDFTEIKAQKGGLYNSMGLSFDKPKQPSNAPVLKTSGSSSSAQGVSTMPDSAASPDVYGNLSSEARRHLGYDPNKGASHSSASLPYNFKDYQYKPQPAAVEASDAVLNKLNYMIELLEEQKDEKTESTTEEVILYSFMGVFLIFVCDSFTRATSYKR